MATRPIHLMIVGAHPADSFDQAGGTLAHHIEQGDRATALIVTTGSRSHDWESIDEKIRRDGDLDMEQRVAASREKKLDEVRRACAILGITDVIERKIRALDCISSQYYGGAYSRKRAEVEDGASGAMAEVPYAEQFQRFTPWVCYTLPISDFELRKTEETGEEAMARRSHWIAPDVPLPDGSSGPEYRFDKDIYK